MRVVELLLSKGADTNAEDNNGYTPLDVAVESGEEEVATLLRKAMGR